MKRFGRSEEVRLCAQALEPSTPRIVARVLTAIGGRRSNQSLRRDIAESQFIFIHIPKTAGTAVTTALGLRNARHIPLCRYESILPKQATRCFKFAIVRDPIDRFVSAFFGVLRTIESDRSRDGAWARKYLTRTMTPENFVESLRDTSRRQHVLRWTHFRPQVSWVRSQGTSTIGCDFLGRFERLNDAWTHIRSHVKSVDLPAELPQVRAGNRVDARTLLSRKSVQMLADIYRDDFETFGYRV